MSPPLAEPVQITLQTEWQEGERFRLTLDGPRGQWEPGELFDLAREAAEAAGMIDDRLTVLKVALRWPNSAGASVHLRR